MSVEKLIVDHMETWTSALQTRSTAGRGSSGKIDLYGIKKLRELILELAVRGKLVPQDPNDEPASELLKRIAAEKAELVKQGKIKKQKPLPEISEEEKPFELPEGWEWARINDIASFTNGYAFKSSEFQNSGVGIVKIGDIDSSGFISTAGMSYVSEKKINVLPEEMRVNPGDMVIAMSGATTGKLGFNKTKSTFLLNQRVGKIVTYSVDKEFIYHYLSTRIEENLSISLGSAIPNISTAQINNIIIPIPPSDEQVKIIARVKLLISLCDQLEQQSLTSLDAHQQLVETLLGTLTDSQNAEELAENWARISEHFDTLFTTEASVDALKQTILQLAVMGKLLNNTNNADYKKLRTYLSFGPKNGLSPVESKKETQLKVLKLGATSYGQLNLNETKFIDVDIEKDSHLFLKKGDILIQRGNSANFVGCNVLINEDYKNIIYPDLMMKIRTNDNLLPEYASIWLSSPLVRNFMWDRMTGTSGTMPKISKKIVEEIPIIVPEISIQQKWITTVNLMLDICSEIKYRLHKAKQTQLHLADALTDAAIN
ncbi:TPA: restriction endonuclease subunit S [Escherichia coli]|uniref:restriction endonuclease subunit S n=1 Tax=Escherichia coli TaxID=562 RepID=UPI00038F4875|nr:restriction endonuclease subunit S [Escherichia coli]EAC1469020.1 restriction endonuclease subunit S [Escherichia coli]EEW1713382.1 restriction endonuclease subunit S [Escherichia coli]EEW2199278.1 restriction endonuclease subunit S [Escherichia coli]EEX9441507.1 restriction endonuclease subunit S [Escherichia coli]EFA1209609.1 restriction endonuclease subunit S [Escherichia coli]